MAETLLEVEDLEIRYGPVTVVRGLSLDVSRGMVGESVTDLTESERATKTNGDAVKAVPTPVAGSCRPVLQRHF